MNKKIGNPYSHYFLYAKGWYKRSEDVMSDLKKIQSDYSGCPVSGITENDVYHVLLTCIYPIVSKSEYSFLEFISDVMERGLLDTCLGRLSVVSVESAGGFFRPSEKILPLIPPKSKIDEFDWVE